MAKFKTQEVVLGIQKSKGVLENGRTYDSTKVNIKTDLREENGVGFAAISYNWGTSDNYDKMLREGYNKFPAVCEIEYLMEASGNNKNNVVVTSLVYKKAGDELSVQQPVTGSNRQPATA